MKWSCLLYVIDLHKFGCGVVFDCPDVAIVLFFRCLRGGLQENVHAVCLYGLFGNE